MNDLALSLLNWFFFVCGYLDWKFANSLEEGD